MAISPPSDIVLDVARAAEPQALETARARLSALGAAANDPAAFQSNLADLRSTLGGGNSGAPATPESFVKFEAMVLQSFVQSMLPSEAQQVYGQGTAGEMWKSLLAEKLADTMAQRGGIGIADRVLSDHYVAGDQRIPVSGINGDPAARERADQQARLSSALVEELQRSAISAVTDGAATASDKAR